MEAQPLECVAQPQEPTKIWNAMFLSIFFANMAMNLGMFMSNSLLSVYADSLGASSVVVGMLVSTFAVSAILFRLIAAPLMDTYNRKYIVIIAMITLAVSFFGYSLSRNVPGLMAFRLLQGAGMAFGNACCLAMVSETLPKAQYGTGIGYYSLAQVVSSAIGPSIGLCLVSLVGYSWTYVVNACILLIAAVLASRIRIHFRRTKRFRLTWSGMIAREALLPTFLLLFLSMGMAAVNSFLILFANENGMCKHVGLYFTVSALTMVFTRPIVGKLTDKFGLVKVWVPALL